MKIIEKNLDNLLVASLKTRDKYTEEGKYFEKLGKLVGFSNIAGPGITIYLSEPENGVGDYEVCFPIKTNLKIEGAEIKTLKGGNAITVLHKGPYEGLGDTWMKFWEYVQKNNITPKAPPREIYSICFVSTSDPNEYVTELQIFV